MPIRTAHVFVSSSDEPLIWPPVIVANKNDEIEINNATDDDIVIIYPSGVFDDGGSLETKKTAHVEAKKTKAPKKKVFNNNSVLGNHPFQVFCFATRSFAKGNSDPEIIIE